MSLPSLFVTSYNKLTQREQKISFLVLIALLALAIDQLFLYTQHSLSAQKLKLLQNKETYSSLELIHESLHKQMAELKLNAQKYQDINSQKQLAQLEHDMTQKIQHMAAAHHLNAVIKKILDRSTKLSLEKLNSLKPLPLRSNGIPEISNNLKNTSNQVQSNSQETKNEMEPVKTTPYTHIIKNGLQVSLTGHYLAVLKFIEKIEQINEHIFWNKFEYKVSKYPKAQVLLDIYSLSINKEVSQIEQID